MRILEATFFALLCAPWFGCGDDGKRLIEANGAWADGTPIEFSLPPTVEKKNGRVSLEAIIYGTQRFMGIRISYDPAQVAAVEYQLAGIATDPVAVYALRSTEMPSNVVRPAVSFEYIANSGAIVFRRLPASPGGSVSGFFRDLKMHGDGAPLLEINEGSFRADVP